MYVHHTKGIVLIWLVAFFRNSQGSASKLVRVAQQALDKGIEQARAGNHLSDISAAIQSEVERMAMV